MDFEKGHKQFEEMLVRYDEVLAQKANKMSIIDVEKKCYDKFARRDDMLEQKEDY